MTCAATTADQAARITTITTDLTWIAESWEDLYELRLPGARRRAPRRPMSRAARERADELARIEKAEQGLSILGASQAPMDVSVLDTLANLLGQAVELADRIAMTAGITDCEPPTTSYDFEAIPRALAYTAQHLTLATDVDPGVLDDTERVVRWMRRKMATSLNELTEGQVLPGLCAWCHGATTTAPAGGECTLTVRVVAGEPLIVCESDLCEPPPEDCGTWLRGRPAWHREEWEWLAARLGAA